MKHALEACLRLSDQPPLLLHNIARFINLGGDYMVFQFLFPLLLLVHFSSPWRFQWTCFACLEKLDAFEAMRIRLCIEKLMKKKIEVSLVEGYASKHLWLNACTMHIHSLCCGKSHRWGLFIYFDNLFISKSVYPISFTIGSEVMLYSSTQYVVTAKVSA